MFRIPRRSSWFRSTGRRTGGTVLPMLLLGAGMLVGTLLLAEPSWAPEDTWRLVVDTPGSPTPAAIAARVVDTFLADHKIRLRPDLRRSIAEAVADQSRRHRIRPRLLLSVILSESSFRTDAVSSRGAVGLMQLLPSTAAAIASEVEITWDGESRLLDPRVNIALGAHYLSYLLDTFDGDLQLALAAYNMGPTRVLSRIAGHEGGAAAASVESSYARNIVARL